MVSATIIGIINKEIFTHNNVIYLTGACKNFCLYQVLGSVKMCDKGMNIKYNG